MDSLRKGLGGLMLLVGLAALFNYYFFHIIDVLGAKYVGQTIWDIIDPIIIAVLVVSIALNVADSLRARSGGGGSRLGLWPRDALTALVAITLMFYAHNYLLKVSAGVDVADPWIWHFIVPPTVVFLAVDGIAHWRWRPS